jgi:hypothetical protein
MELTRTEKKGVAAIKKAFRNRNHPDAIKGGKELLRQAKEDIAKKKKAGESSTFNASMDAAKYLINRARGNISIVVGYTYCCFDCLNHRTKIKVEGKLICAVCQNGQYFQKKGSK